MVHAEGPFNRQPFDHRQHVKFAWSVLKESSVAEAMEVVGSEIREFAQDRAPGKYHETLTQFWVLLVAHTRVYAKPGEDFDEHVARFPILMDSKAQMRHYSSTVLWSERARKEFVQPDLLAMP